MLFHGSKFKQDNGDTFTQHYLILLTSQTKFLRDFFKSGNFNFMDFFMDSSYFKFKLNSVPWFWEARDLLPGRQEISCLGGKMKA